MYLNHFLITFDGSPCYSPPTFNPFFFGLSTQFLISLLLMERGFYYRNYYWHYNGND